MELLRQPRPARTGGGRVLSRRAAVPDLVVSLVLSHPDDGPVPVRQCDLAVHRTAGRRIAAAAEWGCRAAWLAVALSGRRAAAHHHVFCDLFPADGPAA